MVKLADTLVSGTSAERLGGSSPPLGKKEEIKIGLNIYKKP
jgi:hypothetical protein